MPHTVTLRIWADGVRTAYHITVVRLLSLGPLATADALRQLLIVFFGGQCFGRNNVYHVVGVPVRGQNSFSIDLASNRWWLDTVRANLFGFIVAQPGVVADTSRYPATGGLPYQHVDTKGQPVPFINQDITFVIEVS